MDKSKQITHRSATYLALCLLAMASAGTGCDLNRKKAAPALPVIHELTGNIRVTNDCDGKLASIPKQVVVWAELTNTRGNVGVYGHSTVTLTPDPKNPNNPIKIGVYSLQVQWPPSAGTPLHWKPPFVLVPGSPTFPSVTPIDVTPWTICPPIPCPSGTGPCRDMVPPKNISPVKPPFPTAHDIEIVCSCN